MQNVSDVAKQWIRDKGGELLSQGELQKRLVAIDQQAEQKSAEDYLALKRKVYERDSLWPSGKKTTFSFERWLPERQPNKKAATEIKAQTQNLFKRLRREAFNVFLNGSAGVGKTAMTLALVDAFERYTNKTTMFVSAVSLREAVMFDFSDSQAKAKLKRIEKSMLEVDVLVIDDFGSEVGMAGSVRQATERLQQFYMRVADARYEVDENDKRTKCTIITSNNTRSELSAMYNDKLISRLVTKKPANILLFVGLEDVRE
ncbi:ATP-binding protein [Leuconostoc gasicomitatum]|uniref:ATP-binding protein n=1 Tax=Leuconostoc gasicomitatum TaxID=115778 RepID=UPI001CC77C41|nr:ATP-binding protein [Leuconostoc gasicomitatum]MBZ5958172.1 ATP-binding protein [Leuconostoc gasicomitatum]